MPRNLLYLIVFIEGFCSLGAEIIALRRLVPHVGSAILVTAPTIGLFLLALALGYGAGARVSANFTTVVARNFLLSALIAGVGLARVTVDGVFSLIEPTGLAYLLFIGGVLCPLAWLLGQTVPVLTNLMKHTRTGEASGYALYWSTLGSFLGSVSLSLVVMQWLGVSAAVLVCALLLAAGSLLFTDRSGKRWAAALGVALVSIAINLRPAYEVVDTAYADYAVKPMSQSGQSGLRAFFVNNSLASQIDDSQPPQYFRYVQHLRRILLDELEFKGREILVLGAGGFTLSHREPSNQYTYVDIDPQIRAIAEQRFLREPIRGRFVADDARRYVRSTALRYDAVVVDVYSSHNAIPGHLVTREFWQDARRTLQPEGVLLANLILDGRLETPYARNLLATIESVFGRCAVEVLQKSQALSNVIVSCHESSRAGPVVPYTDERNGSEMDTFRSR